MHYDMPCSPSKRKYNSQHTIRKDEKIIDAEQVYLRK